MKTKRIPIFSKELKVCLLEKMIKILKKDKYKPEITEDAIMSNSEIVSSPEWEFSDNYKFPVFSLKLYIKLFKLKNDTDSNIKNI